MVFKLLGLTGLLFILAFQGGDSCPEKWYKLSPTSTKCVRYFHQSVNFTEAQFICNDIYEGNLASINSVDEQKQVVQYLYDQLGYGTMPVTWLGGVLTSNKFNWVDGSDNKYTNFAQPLKAIQVDGKKCVKILSLFAKGDSGVAGQWTEDNCALRDSGFICEKKIGFTVSRGRVKEVLQADNEGASGPALVSHFTEQLKAIKELCETQIRAIEHLSTNFVYILENDSSKKGKPAKDK